MADTEVTEKRRTVVMAMDASKHSECALQWYVDTLYQPGDKVFLAYCAEPVTSFPPMVGVSATGMVDMNPAFAIDMAKEHEEQVNQTLQKIDEIAQKYMEKLEHRVKRLTGSPGQAIVQAAYDQNADLIVCGSRGQGLFRRTILGSVSDFIVHHSTIPVVVCKHEDEHPKVQGHKD